jgi:chitin synthase
MEHETTEVVKETSARRRWVLLCWLLTWWIPSPSLKWFGRMKRQDVRQAWREKLALNIIIWFICACAIFVIAILDLVICPTEHVFSTSELASHAYTSSKNNVYTAVRDEVFALTQAAATHQRAVQVIPTKTILQQYGALDATNLFPVQVSRRVSLISLVVIIFVGQLSLQRCLWLRQSMGSAYFGQHDGS